MTASVSRLTNGRPLPPTTRERMERSYGTGLGHVRVHTDAAASDLTHASGAEAAAVGNHIAFAPGTYRPGTRSGDHLIAHEVSHVVQQGGVSGPLRMRLVHSQPSDPAEVEADQAADRVVRGQAASITPGRFATTRDRLMRRARPGAAEPRDGSPEPPRRRPEEEESSPARGAAPTASSASAPPLAAPAPAAAEPVDAASTAGPDEMSAEASEAAPAPEEATEAAPEEAAAAPAPALRVEPQMPPPPESLGPAATERLEAARSGAGGAARSTSALPSATENTEAARASVTEPEEQRLAEANNALVAALDQRPEPSPEIEALCQRIYQAIRDKRPPDEDSLVDADPEEAAREAGAELDTTIQSDTERVEGSYDQLQEGGTARPAEPGAPVEEPPRGAETPPINASGAAPDPVPAENVSLDADVESSAAQMDEAGMTSEPAQLVQEGPIAEARSAQGELAETAARDPAQVIAEQNAAIASAQGDMAALQASALEALNSSRASSIHGASSQQVGMQGSEEQMRADVGARAQTLFTDAQTRVRALLEPLARTAMQRWEAGLPALSREFRSSLDDVKRSIEERHSGVGGAILGAVDYVTGLPDWVVRRYDEAEATFGDGVCELIREISRDVNAVIAAAEAIIAESRRQIDELFASLPAELQTWAEEQRGQFAERLDGLTQEVHETRDNFNRDLGERAAGAVQEVREEIHALREAAGGLLGRIAAAIAAFIDDPFRFIINGLLSLLGIPPASFWRVVDRLGEVISGIADDPLGFANNLLEAVKQGFQRFFDNIADHLLQGLLDWLFSGLGSVGVEIPRDFSLRSIVTFFLQLMGLTWANIRQILARHIGEENVALLEQAYQLISTLIEQGPAGIFEMIKEQLNPSAILERVMDAAIDFVIEALITRVTVRIIAMLNPAGAILTAIEAIYRVIRWIFENAARIFTLVETIVNGAFDLMNGNVGGMAGAIESALARLIPPVIDFLAGFIGLGNLPESIADVIRGMQQWVLGIVDRVIGFIAGQARRLLASLGIGGEEEDQQNEDDLGSHRGMIRHAIEQLSRRAEGIEGYEPLRRAKETEAREIEDRHAAVLRAETPPVAMTVTFADPATDDRDEDLDFAVRIAPNDEQDSGSVRLGPEELPPTQVTPTPNGDRAGSVQAEPLSKLAGNTRGSGPSGVVPGWDHVLRIDNQLLNPKTAQWGPAYWVRAHLLSERLHGPGRPWNLVPARKTANTSMEAGPEAEAKRRLDQDEVLYYRASVDGYHSGDILENFPTGLSIEYGTMKHEGDAWVRDQSFAPFSVTLAAPPLDPDLAHVIDLRTAGRSQLEALGVSRGLTARIQAERGSGGAFRDQADFITRMTALYGRLTPAVDFVSVHWPAIQRLIDQGLASFET